MNEMTEKFEEWTEGDKVENIENVEFITRDGYGKDPLTSLICIKCRSKQFEVAQVLGGFSTYIKCPICKYEIEIHSG